MGEPSKLLLGSVISVFTWISKYIASISRPGNNCTFMPSIGSSCVGYFYLFIFLSYNHSPEKWRFPALKSLLLPQFLTYRHRTGFIVKRKQVRITNYLGLPINWLKKNQSYLFCEKNTRCSKNSLKCIIQLFFQKEIIGHTYICIKCNDNFKFIISLKSYENLLTTPSVFNKYIFSFRKIFTNKYIFSKHDLHVLFISLFSKMYNKKIIYRKTISLRD